MGVGSSAPESRFTPSFRIRSTTEGGRVSPVVQLAISNTSRWLAYASSENLIWLWSMELFQHVSVLTGHEDTIWALGYSPDDRYLLSSSSDNTVRFWLPKNSECVFVLRPPGLLSWCFTWHNSHEGRFALGAVDGRVAVYQLMPPVHPRDTKLPACDLISSWWAHSKSIVAIKFSDVDFNKLVTASKDGTFAIWSMTDQATDTVACLMRIAGHVGPLGALVLNPVDNNIIATAGDDCTIRIWDVREYRQPEDPPEAYHMPHQLINGQKGKPTQIVIDDELIICSSDDGLVKIWNIPRSETPGISEAGLVAELRYHGGSVNALAWVGDNSSCFVSAGSDGSILCWRVPLEWWKDKKRSQVRLPAQSNDEMEVLDGVTGQRI